MEPRPLRIAYAIEYLFALIAFFESWSQIGGQAPLDLMPWWLKMAFAATFAFVVVRLTSAAVQNERFPSVAVFRWGLVLLVVLIVVGLTTYFFYIHEPPDDDASDSVTTNVLLRDQNAFSA